jgi:Zn-dependent protease
VDYLPPPHDHEPSPRNVTKRRPGGGALGAGVAAVIAFLAKFKLLLLVGLKLLAPSWTFLLSLWVYVVIFGWRLAVVLMFVLLAHELGHYFAFRAYGLPVRLPAFVPLLGAFTAGAVPQELEHDAYIALAGPLTGLGLAAAFFGFATLTQDRFWYACADLSAFLNLFNLIPVPPFDGGRIANALWPPLWIGGLVLFVAFAIFFHVPIFFVAIIALLGLPAIMNFWKGHVDPRAARMTLTARIRVSGWYLATLIGLVYVMAQAHAIATPGSVGQPIW